MHKQPGIILNKSTSTLVIKTYLNGENPDESTQNAVTGVDKTIWMFSPEERLDLVHQTSLLSILT